MVTYTTQGRYMSGQIVYSIDEMSYEHKKQANGLSELDKLRTEMKKDQQQLDSLTKTVEERKSVQDAQYKMDRLHNELRELHPSKIGLRYRMRKDDEKNLVEARATLGVALATKQQDLQTVQQIEETINTRSKLTPQWHARMAKNAAAEKEREAKRAQEDAKRNKEMAGLEAKNATLREAKQREIDEHQKILDAASEKLNQSVKAQLSHTSSSVAMQKMVDDLKERIGKMDAKIRELEGKATNDFESPPDRDMKELFRDIMSHPGWMLCTSKDEKSAEKLQYIQGTQRQVEEGKIPKTNEYADITNYWMYSGSRKCAVWLHKTGSNPATWGYRYYYTPCPFADVEHIFKACQGADVTSKFANIQIDKFLFADAKMS